MRILVLLAVALTLSACGSRLNPLNWFGSAEEAPVETAAVQAEATAELDPLAGLNLVGQLTDLDVEQIPTGAIITATGLPPRQGFWQADLVELGVEDGVVLYAFTISEPPGPTPEGPPQSREIVVATSISNQSLAPLRAIRVVSATNQLTSRR